MIVKELVEKLEALAPRYLAESWDNVGLQIGSYDQVVERVLVTLDVSPQVVLEAVEKQIDLIVTHHPMIFKAPKSLVEHDPMQKMYIDLIRNGISVYAMHTNLDNAPDGMNDWLAQQLDLTDVSVLDEIGTMPDGTVYGTGRVGVLKEEMSLEQFVTYVSKRMITQGVRFVGDKQKRIKRVALCGGAAEGYYTKALEKGADVYVTGDVKYHTAQDMDMNGLACVDPGHFIESVCKEVLQEKIQKWAAEYSWQIDVLVSDIVTDPFQFQE